MAPPGQGGGSDKSVPRDCGSKMANGSNNDDTKRLCVTLRAYLQVVLCWQVSRQAQHLRVAIRALLKQMKTCMPHELREQVKRRYAKS